MSLSASDVLAIFDRVSQTDRLSLLDVGAYSVECLSAAPGVVYIGCSSSGELALIVTTSKSSPPPAGLRLVSLIASFGVVAQLAAGATASEVRVSILRCESKEHNVRLLFASVCATFAEQVSLAPTEAEFSSYISRWLTLFWQLGQRTSVNTAGLAGELLVILGSTDADRWVDAWHSDPKALYDFSFDDTNQSVEVKSTRGQGRNHVVSLEQATGPQAYLCHFASVQLSFDEAGETIGEIVRRIVDSLENESSQLKLWSVLTRTCGSSLDEVLSARLDLATALKSIAFYAATDVPAPSLTTTLPRGVTAVSFRSDFELAEESVLTL